MRGRVLVAAPLIAGCASASNDSTKGAQVSGAPPRAMAALVPDDVFDGLPTGADQLAILCARKGGDAVSKAFCSTPAPTIHGLVDLEEALGLGFADRTTAGRNGASGNPGFALSGHSASLVGRFASAFNPRAFLFTPSSQGPAPGFVALAFTRGETFVEVAAHDPTDPGPEAINLYLIRFVRSDCDDSAVHRLMSSVEKGWARVDVYEDDDLANSILDCTRCHQPGGPGARKILRMHEHTDPWTHFFRADRPGGRGLLDDFHLAHGTDEDYAGIPGALIERSDPALLAALVENNGFREQPNAFDAAAIEREVESFNPLQPQTNTPPGRSATWQRLFDVAASAAAAPPPYHDVKVYDAQRLKSSSDAYREVLAGASIDDDLRDVFLDDAMVDTSVRPPPDASGRAILTEMCQDCHNPTVDPALSRARFDVTRLDSMPRGEKDMAIARLRAPATTRHHMPPLMFRALDDVETARVTAELQK